LYLDAGAGGRHFAVTAKANRADGLLHAVNEDLRNGLSVRDCLQRHVQVRRPEKGIPHVSFGVVGQVGTLNGINSRGLAVSTSILLDSDPVPATENRRLHTVLVKNVLENAADIDAALVILKNTQSTAHWGLCLSHHPSDRVCYVEFDGSELRIEPQLTSVIAANHRLMKSVAEKIPQPSMLRLQRLQDLLGGERLTSITPARAQTVLRDLFDMKRGQQAEFPTLNMVRRVDNQTSILMQPASGDIWLTPGPMANGRQNEFLHLNLADLFRFPAEEPAESAVAVTEPGVLRNVIKQKDFDELAARIRSDDVDDGARICHRFVMRLIETPIETTAEKRTPWPARTLILGENRVADELCRVIQSQGGTPTQLPSDGDADVVIAALENAWQNGPLPQLLLVSAFDDDAKTVLEQVSWNRRMERGVLVPFYLAQRWCQLVADAGLTDRAEIVAVTAMGGDFGLSGNVHSVEGGALAGLVKDLHLEIGGKCQRNFRTKIVDFAGDAGADDVAAALSRELSQETADVEVGYVNEIRYLPRPVFEAVEPRQRSEETTGGVWVITGGARGITAVVAAEIGRRFGAKLHLVGSTPLTEIPEKWHELTAAELKELRGTVMKEALANGEKPIDVWTRYEKAIEVDKTLRAFAAQGIQATYHACDVADRQALETVLNEVRRIDGPITGIVHGAGYERAGKFEKKKREFVERTLLPKLNGAAALMDLTRDDPLKFFIAFSSVSGRFGSVGQADYAAANEMLGKLVDWFRRERPDCRSSSFYWHLWGDVGMAVRPETKGYFESLKMNFLPAAEGAAHLIDEVIAGLPEAELVVTDWK
ncbi:MAG: SDR family NAD(P)-dependent oxidoreductase, partial [Planctomycetes bacterium]|nr:SDR family NAD(P)-dependent oxidoreductase [Planctomycetota bacterium]